MLLVCLAFPDYSSSYETIEVLIYLPKNLVSADDSISKDCYNTIIDMTIPCLNLLLLQSRYPIVLNRDNRLDDAVILSYEDNGAISPADSKTFRSYTILTEYEDLGASEESLSSRYSSRQDGQQLFQSLYSSWIYKDHSVNKDHTSDDSHRIHEMKYRDDLLSTMVSNIVTYIETSHDTNPLNIYRQLEVSLYGIYSMMDVCGEIEILISNDSNMPISSNSPDRPLSSSAFKKASMTRILSSQMLFQTWLVSVSTVHSSISQLIHRIHLNESTQSNAIPSNGQSLLPISSTLILVTKRLLQLWTRFFEYFGGMYGKS